MKFLDRAEATAEIKKRVGQSKTVRMAVAYWGKGAIEGLGLTKTKAKVEIVCNLKSGATDPDEIRALLGKKIKVEQCDSLHGKVYLFDDAVIIGSSNASSNGLELEDIKMKGLTEANILVTDPSVRNEARAWIEELPRSPIEDDDLAAAELDRAADRASTKLRSKNLLKEIETFPSVFAKSNIYVAIYDTDLEAEQLAKIKEANTEESIYDGLGWRPPKDAYLVWFHAKKDGIEVSGFNKTLKVEKKFDSDPEIWATLLKNKILGYEEKNLLMTDNWNCALISYRKYLEEKKNGFCWGHIHLASFIKTHMSRSQQ